MTETQTTLVIPDVAACANLTPGQWVVDADGDALCLFNTHFGSPQHMWGKKPKGGGIIRGFYCLESATFPLALADVDPKFVCDHPASNECGQCTVCGQVDIADAHPVVFDPELMLHHAHKYKAYVDTAVPPHRPLTPGFRCVNCGNPTPCDGARAAGYTDTLDIDCACTPDCCGEDDCDCACECEWHEAGR